MTTKTPPIDGLVYEVIPTIDGEPDYSEKSIRQYTDDIEAATVITSRVAGNTAEPGTDEHRVGLHKVVLDIDLPAVLVPSSTPGHHHLYIDHELPWPKYEALLWALEAAGLIENGYAGASSARGHTAARLTWVKKAKPTSDNGTPAEPVPFI